MAQTPAQFFRQLQRNLPRIEREILQSVIQVEAEAFHAENFRKEGFTDIGFQKWDEIELNKKGKGRKGFKRKSILIGEKGVGIMRRHATKGSLRGRRVVFEFPLAYMKVHNDGGKAGRGSGFQMPKRQFVGKSAVLERRIQRKALALLNRRLK